MNKIHIWISTLISFFSFGLGVIYSLSNPTVSLETLIAKKSFIINFLEIAAHNLIIFALMCVFSLVIYIGSTIFVFTSMFAFGASLFVVILYRIDTSLVIFMHSIFEVPAIILSYSITLQLSTLFISKLKSDQFSLGSELSKLKKLVLISIVLFLIGAFIESFVLNFYL